jgi:hypothetical protein
LEQGQLGSAYRNEDGEEQAKKEKEVDGVSSVISGLWINSFGRNYQVGNTKENDGSVDNTSDFGHKERNE